MFDNLEIFRMSNALAVHSSARQAKIASNVANADTPGFRASDISPFSRIYQDSRDDGTLRATRPGHISGGLTQISAARSVDVPGAADPNGNTVSLETEMVKAVEVQHAHETALSVYESARNILRTSLGSGR